MSDFFIIYVFLLHVSHACLNSTSLAMWTMQGVDNTKNNQTLGRRWIVLVFDQRIIGRQCGRGQYKEYEREPNPPLASSFFFFRQNGLSALGKFQHAQTAACVLDIKCKLTSNFIKWLPLRYCMSLPSFEDGKRLVSNEFSPHFYIVPPSYCCEGQAIHSLGFCRISSKFVSDSHVPWPSSKVNISR